MSVPFRIVPVETPTNITEVVPSAGGFFNPDSVVAAAVLPSVDPMGGQSLPANYRVITDAAEWNPALEPQKYYLGMRRYIIQLFTLIQTEARKRNPEWNMEFKILSNGLSYRSAVADDVLRLLRSFTNTLFFIIPNSSGLYSSFVNNPVSRNPIWLSTSDAPVYEFFNFERRRSCGVTATKNIIAINQFNNPKLRALITMGEMPPAFVEWLDELIGTPTVTENTVDAVRVIVKKLVALQIQELTEEVETYKENVNTEYARFLQSQANLLESERKLSRINPEAGLDTVMKEIEFTKTLVPSMYSKIWVDGAGVIHALSTNVDIVYERKIYHMGEYEVLVNIISGEIQFRHKVLSGVIHPHINARPCFGAISDNVYNLISKMQLYSLLHLVRRYLSSYNPNSPYKRIEDFRVPTEDHNERVEV